MSAIIKKENGQIIFNGMVVTPEQYDVLERWGNLPKYPIWGSLGDLNAEFTKDEQIFLRSVPRDADSPYKDLSITPSYNHSPMINGRNIYPNSSIWTAAEKESYDLYRAGGSSKVTRYNKIVAPNGAILNDAQKEAIKTLVDKIPDVIEKVNYMKLFNMSVEEDLLEEYYFEKHNKKLAEKPTVKVIKKQ